MGDLGVGRLELPPDWEMRSQITYLEPETPTSSHRLRPSEPRPRGNLVVSRSPTDVSSAEQARDEFLEQAADSIRGLTLEEDPGLTFADGAEGASVTLTFDGTPHIRLAQRHVFRLDGAILTQIVATVDVDRMDELDGRLREIIVSFRTG